MRRSRARLRGMALKRWHCWLDLRTEQQEAERLAALVTIQSWMRTLLAKRVRSSYREQHAATQLQSFWRGFYCRKMHKRRARCRLYTQASQAIQRCFRAHVCRCGLRAFMHRHNAACIITRSVRRYCIRRRLERDWCHRLARFHAAIVLQVWLRYQVARIRRTRARKRMHGSAARILQHFFKRAHFVLVFDKRVQCLLQQKTNAAMKLQSAYRARIARARFHELKDRLEEQKRQEILRCMWENAYATSIQTWWRKAHLCQKKRHAEEEAPSSLDPHN